MKSLKGHFIQTNIWMVVISSAWIVLITLLLLFLFATGGNEEFRLALETFHDILNGSQSGFQGLVLYVFVWGSLVAVGVIATCVILSSNLCGAILKPFNQIKEAAHHIAEGNLDFEVMGCECRELNDLCSSVDEIRKRLKIGALQQMRVEEERHMLMANLSHDMRTPITTIKGYVEGIQDGIAASPEKIQAYLDTIYSKTLVLERLVDNMTEYSELELGRMQYVFEYVDVRDYLQDLSEEYRGEVEERGFQLQLHLTDKPMTIVADRSKLKRVLDNLISNAMKYNREKGTVVLSSETDGKGVLICVADNGNGIKKEDVNKVFDGFYRGDAARSNIKGNGLGLSIAKQIVESHHGKIWIKSEEGKGTTVYLYVPLRKRG